MHPNTSEVNDPDHPFDRAQSDRHISDTKGAADANTLPARIYIYHV